MRRLQLLALALFAISSALPAQSFWDASVRAAPQFHAYDIKTPFNEKISEFSFPFFVLVPVLPQLSMDVGTAFATVQYENASTNAKSHMSGLTDTQVRANYTFGQDFVVLTAGVNLPSGSATIESDKVAAATRIGSDFLTFPVSGFGSGLGFTGGVAVARPLGAWSVGFGASMRQSSEYEPFRNDAGVATKYQPGPEYRARFGMDHPYGTGRVSLGLTFSKFGDDKANAAVFNSGDRYVSQFAVNNALTEKVDYALVVWDLYRTSGTLIDTSASPSGNITNALVTLGLRGPREIRIEPSIETRLWTQEGSRTSYLGTLAMRFVVNRGGWAIVPGFGFSVGSMESASLTGYRATLGVRFGS
jgi:hypothetical protein